MSNRLVKEKSPYLLQHKDNPVDWYPWGKEAFLKAEKEDKPVFLSIGYSTCHWCHVMAHESFEDAEVAKLLEDYVCIKVDREERPDIDAVYMSVCQAITGSGGWPLTVIMTPDQKPFFAGTYFPKNSIYGHIGLTRLLPHISRLWREDREKIAESSEEITSVLQRDRSESSCEADKTLLYRAYAMLMRNFDSEWGGFGPAPKFPAPHNLLFLMRMYEAERLPKALGAAEATLRAMAAGGIFDHIGGGFSRYSTDKMWLIPHFEKMLYDNALLIMAYLEAFQLTKNAFYADVAKRTAEYVLTELNDAEGGFYCGQDADSDGEEGKYYAFSPDEIIGILGQRDGGEFCRMYGITETGNFLSKCIPNRIGKDGLGWNFEDKRLKRLYEYRKERARLNTDDKILLSWNAWMIAALSRAGLILGEKRYIDAAVKARKFIEKRMTRPDGRLYVRYCGGEAAHTGQLDDYAVYAFSLTELYRATFNAEYLREAVFWAKRMSELFEDRENGGYYITAHDAEPLIYRPKETYDGAVPSGNSVAEAVMERLAHLTGDMFFRESADRQHRFMAGRIKEYPETGCFALTAMADALYPHREIIYTGRELPGEIKAYLRARPAHETSVIFKSDENAEELSSAAPFTRAYDLSAGSAWYMCENGACRAPVRTFKELRLT